MKGLAVAERRVKQPRASLICVHGGLDRGGSFARLARRTESFDLIAYDRRGYQGSRGLQPLSFQDHVQDLLAIARRERAHGPVLYLGHSYGGVIALGAAIAEPTLCQLVVCYEAPVPWILKRENPRPKVGHDPEHEAELFFRRMVSNGAWERLSEYERESRRLDGPGLFSDLELLDSGRVPFDLTDLQSSLLYLHGDWSAAPFYRDLCRVLATITPLATSRELANAGHGAHLANPDQLATILDDAWAVQCESA